MDFDLKEPQRELVERVSRVLTTAWGPEAEAAAECGDAFPTRLFRSLADAGLLGQRVPRAYGGAGGSLVDVALIALELGRRSGLAVSMCMVNTVAAEVLASGGTEDQRRDLLPRFVRGELSLAFALTEPQASRASRSPPRRCA